jgi:hypothetical protein
LRTAATQNEIKMLTFESYFCDRVLRDDAAIVFDLNIEAVVWQNALAKFQDFREPIGTEAVFGVVTDMCLQQHFFFSPGLAAAVDEFFHHVTNFGHMCVSRDIIAIRQYKTREGIRRLLQSRHQLVQFHADLYSNKGI